MPTVETIVEKCGAGRENLLEILHELQNSVPQHYLKKDDLHELAEILSVPVAEILGTASFYSMFSFEPRGENIIRVCDSPPCFLQGGEVILNRLQEMLGTTPGETTEDGRFTLETTGCLGLCGVAPAMTINNEAYGNLEPDSLSGILERWVEEASP